MQNIRGSHNGAVPSLRESNVVVGDVESFSKESKIVGEIAFSVLNGQKPQGIPIAKGATDYMFDWRALHPWGIKDSDLLAGSVVLNRQPRLESRGFPGAGDTYLLSTAAAILVGGGPWHYIAASARLRLLKGKCSSFDVPVAGAPLIQADDRSFLRCGKLSFSFLPNMGT
jgi:hypothetical protein